MSTKNIRYKFNEFPKFLLMNIWNVTMSTDRLKRIRAKKQTITIMTKQKINKQQQTVEFFIGSYMCLFIRLNVCVCVRVKKKTR